MTGDPLHAAHPTEINVPEENIIERDVSLTKDRILKAGLFSRYDEGITSYPFDGQYTSTDNNIKQKKKDCLNKT
jgi:hypothetical protein